MLSATSRMPETTWVMLAPAARIFSTLASTWLEEVPIKVRISFEDSAERCASERTSLATTAKPRPDSPARAASTAAFSARILVWNARPSITPTISSMRLALA